MQQINNRHAGFDADPRSCGLQVEAHRRATVGYRIYQNAVSPNLSLHRNRKHVSLGIRHFMRADSSVVRLGLPFPSLTLSMLSSLHPRIAHRLLVFFFLTSFALGQWSSYPSCALPCLEYYSSAICGNAEMDLCECGAPAWGGSVAECSRVACGVANGGSELVQLWERFAFDCVQIGGLVPSEDQFLSSAGIIGTTEVLPISTTATIFASSITFTIDPGNGLTALSTAITGTQGIGKI